MENLQEILKLAEDLIEARVLSSAKVEIVKKSIDDDRTRLLHTQHGVLITQQYTHNLSGVASEMYMLVGYMPDSNTYRVYHNTGFTAGMAYNCLGGALGAEWESRRTQLIYSGTWTKGK